MQTSVWVSGDMIPPEADVRARRGGHGAEAAVTTPARKFKYLVLEAGYLALELL